MPEKMIRQHDGHYRFAHRHGADADAGVVAALGRHIGLLAVRRQGWTVRDLTPSPLGGGDGNEEFLIAAWKG